MFKRLFLLSLLPLFCAAYELPIVRSLPAPVDVWLFVGQSNMVATSSGDTVIFTTANNDALLPIWKRAGNSPVTMHVGIDTLATVSSDARGCEFGFLRVMHSRGHYRTVVLKHATNGKALYSWWLPGYTGYTNLLASIAQFESDIAPQLIRYRGIVWVQGSADANVDASVASGYQSGLGTFLTQLRLDLETPDLIFISPEHPPGWSVKPYAAEVKAAVTAFCAADSRAVSFGVEDTTTRDAGTHYEASDGSFEIIGVRAANAYLDNF